MSALFHSHIFWVGLYGVFKFLFDAAVGALDSPGVNGAPTSPRYRFWFKFLNRCAANFSRSNSSGNWNGNGAASNSAAAGK